MHRTLSSCYGHMQEHATDRWHLTGNIDAHGWQEGSHRREFLCIKEVAVAKPVRGKMLPFFHSSRLGTRQLWPGMYRAFVRDPEIAFLRAMAMLCGILLPHINSRFLGQAAGSLNLRVICSQIDSARYAAIKADQC